MELEILSNVRIHLPALEESVTSFVAFHDRHRKCEGLRAFLDSWLQESQQSPEAIENGYRWRDLRGVLEELIADAPDVPDSFGVEAVSRYRMAMARLDEATGNVRGVVRNMDGAELIGTRTEVHEAVDGLLPVLASIAGRSRKEAEGHMKSMHDSLDQVFVQVARIDSEGKPGGQRPVADPTAKLGEEHDAAINNSERAPLGQGSVDDTRHWSATRRGH